MQNEARRHQKLKEKTRILVQQVQVRVGAVRPLGTVEERVPGCRPGGPTLPLPVHCRGSRLQREHHMAMQPCCQGLSCN